MYIVLARFVKYKTDNSFKYYKFFCHTALEPILQIYFYASFVHIHQAGIVKRIDEGAFG